MAATDCEALKVMDALFGGSPSSRASRKYMYLCGGDQRTEDRGIGPSEGL